jgi:hypothetical protein
MTTGKNCGISLGGRSPRLDLLKLGRVLEIGYCHQVPNDSMFKYELLIGCIHYPSSSVGSVLRDASFRGLSSSKMLRHRPLLLISLKPSILIDQQP